MLLYPRLTPGVARALAEERCNLPPETLRPMGAVSHTHVIYTPTGGRRVPAGHLERLQQLIRVAADDTGFPARLNDVQRTRFDADSSRILHSHMDLSPAEASQPGIWEFLACVVLPDVVRWRFPGPGGSSTSLERFTGGIRGLRNTFGRTWWRATILHVPDTPDPYTLLVLLGEDELVQITERPNLAGSRPLARQVAHSFLAAAAQNPAITRSDLLRDAMKRLRRLLPIVAFDALGDALLKQLVDDIFAESAASLISHSAARGGALA